MAITVDFRVLKNSIREMGASLCHYPISACERKPFKSRSDKFAEKKTPQDAERFMLNEHKELKKELEQRKKELDKWEKELTRYFESSLSANKEQLNIILNRLQTQTHNNQEQIKTVELLKHRNDQLYRENQNYKARLDRCKKKVRKLEAGNRERPSA
jgi:exonuclease VII large subunit